MPPAIVKFESGTTITGPVDQLKELLLDHIRGRTEAGDTVKVVDASMEIMPYIIELQRIFRSGDAHLMQMVSGPRRRH